MHGLIVVGVRVILVAEPVEVLEVNGRILLPLDENSVEEVDDVDEQDEPEVAHLDLDLVHQHVQGQADQREQGRVHNQILTPERVWVEPAGVEIVALVVVVFFKEDQKLVLDILAD